MKRKRPRMVAQRRRVLKFLAKDISNERRPTTPEGCQQATREADAIWLIDPETGNRDLIWGESFFASAVLAKGGKRVTILEIEVPEENWPHARAEIRRIKQTHYPATDGQHRHRVR